ncbi:MAG: Gfo/Idh/MocA family protein [Lacipirellulaceae bacterium]
MSLRLGIIGAGAIGAKHAAAASAVGVTVTRVADRDATRADELAATCGATAVAEHGQLLADSEVDAVVVGVPNCFHKQIALEAMRAGKDVLLEKPMALSAAECDELLDCQAETGRVLQIGFAHRYTAVGQGAKRVVDQGALGEVYHAKAHLYLRRAVPGLGGWFTTKAMSGGGALIDLGVHLLDLSLHLLGQPKPVSVLGKTYSKFGKKMGGYVYESMWAGPPRLDGVCDVEDSAHAAILFDNGTTLDLQVCWAINVPDAALPSSVVGLFGDRGGLTFELFGDHLRLASEIGGRNADSKILLPEVDQMAAQMAGFAQAVGERRNGTGATGADGRKVQALVDAIYASSDRNAPVAL